MLQHFENITHARQPWKVEYNLLEMTICAVISGCEYWEDIVVKIVEAEADYVFWLKRIQTGLLDDVKLYFETKKLGRKQLLPLHLNIEILNVPHKGFDLVF